MSMTCALWIVVIHPGPTNSEHDSESPVSFYEFTHENTHKYHTHESQVLMSMGFQGSKYWGGRARYFTFCSCPSFWWPLHVLGPFFWFLFLQIILRMSQVHESRIYSVSILIFFFTVKVVSKSSVFLALAISEFCGRWFDKSGKQALCWVAIISCMSQLPCARLRWGSFWGRCSSGVRRQQVWWCLVWVPRKVSMEERVSSPHHGCRVVWVLLLDGRSTVLLVR